MNNYLEYNTIYKNYKVPDIFIEFDIIQEKKNNKKWNIVQWIY